MAKFRVMYTCPTKFELERYAMNGQVPSPMALRRIADGLNHVLCVQKKQVFAYSQDWNNATSGSGSILTLWPVAFRTSRGTTAITVEVGLVKNDYGLGSTPTFQVEVQPLAGGASVVTGTAHFNQRSSGASVVPDDVNYQTLVLSGLDPNTEYKLLTRVFDGARAVFMSVFERLHAGSITAVDGALSVYLVDDGDDDVSNPAQFESEGPIYDTGIRKLITACNSMIKQSRSHLLSYTATPYQQINGSGLGITGSTVYSDVANRTFNIDTGVLTTYRQSGVDAVSCTMAVCADRISGGGTLSVGLYDGSTIQAEVTGIADPGQNNWAVADVTLPAQDASYTIHAKQSDGVTDHELYGVALWVYTA